MGLLWFLLVATAILGLAGFWFQKNSVPNSTFPSNQISVTVYVSKSPAHVTVDFYAYLQPQYDKLDVNVTGPNATSDPWILVVQCPPGRAPSPEYPVYSEGTSGILQLGNAIVSNHDHKNYSQSLGCRRVPTAPATVVAGQNIDVSLPVLEQNPAAQSAQADTPLYVERSKTGKRKIKDLVEVLEPPDSSCQSGLSPSQARALPPIGGNGPPLIFPLQNFFSLPSAVTVPCYTPVAPGTAASTYYFPTNVTTYETLENVNLANESMNSMVPPGQITSDDKVKWQGTVNAALSPSLSVTSLSSARSAANDTFIAGLLIGGAFGFFVPFLQGMPGKCKKSWKDTAVHQRKRKAVRVELRHDGNSWHYDVPGLGIKSDADSRSAALEAIARALDHDPGCNWDSGVALEVTGTPAPNE
jgi:hypothetical protein